MKNYSFFGTKVISGLEKLETIILMVLKNGKKFFATWKNWSLKNGKKRINRPKKRMKKTEKTVILGLVFKKFHVADSVSRIK